ncbi:ECF transporter S component [Spiroplasma endosymbiont of Labia minor]|uniref:ECF transporter S component n=1 Tax=Spiroplasma endosymbiont of Labia minor TaxID=3066305 RepID=UPI0030D073A7
MNKKLSKKTIPNIAKTKRLVAIAVFTAIAIVIRISTASIPGVEFVTFLILSYAFFLPLMDSFIICFITTLIATLLTGFGPWYLVQFIYYPLSVLIIWLCRKLILNQWIFASVISFFSGPWVIFWYFMSDLTLNNVVYAIANIFTAVPIALIQMIVSFCACVILLPGINKIMETSGTSLYAPYIKINLMKTYRYSTVINGLIAFVFILAGIVGTYFLFQTTWYFITLQHQYVWKNTYESKYGLLPEKEYNKVLNNLKNNQSAVVTIIGDMKLISYVTVLDSKTKLSEYIISTDNELSGDDFKMVFDYKGYGQAIYLTGFSLKIENPYSSQNPVQHWGGDYTNNAGHGTCPYILQGSNFESSGAGFINIEKNVVYQFSYDYISGISHKSCTY